MDPSAENRESRRRIARRRGFVCTIFLSVLFLLSSLSPCHALVINEFMASNGQTIADEDGDFEDWIEIFNSGNDTVSLKGFGLSDDSSRPFRWTFPDVRIDSGEFMLIWASGKDRRDVHHQLHTNFRISFEGEPLTLTQPNGMIVDYVAPVRLVRDQSYGRDRDGGQIWLFFDEPTPGESNQNSRGFSSILAEPLIFPESGFYENPPLVRFEAEPAASRVIYTLDGSIPTPEALSSGIPYEFKNEFPVFFGDPEGPFLTAYTRSVEYAGPFTLPERIPYLFLRPTAGDRIPFFYIPQTPPPAGTAFRVQSIDDSYGRSRVVTAVYFDKSIEFFDPPIPVVSLVVPEDALYDYDRGIFTPGRRYDEWRRLDPQSPETPEWWEVLSAHRGPETEVRGSLQWFSPTGELAFKRDVGVRIHGGFSRIAPQKSLRIYSSDALDPRGPVNYPIFGDLRGHGTGAPLTTFPRFLLRNSGNDWTDTRIRDALVQEILKPLGFDDQAYQPALLYINGEFWGLINVRERLDAHYIEAHHGVDSSDVAILQTTREGEELSAGSESDLDEFLSLRAFMASNDLQDSAAFRHVEEQLDVDSFLLYYMANIFVKNTDWPGQNIRVWRKRNPDLSPHSPRTHDGRWRYMLFDLDFAFSPQHLYDNSHNTLAFALAEGGTEWPNPDWSTVMLRSLLQNDGFRHRFIQAFADHMATTFQSTRVDALTESLHSAVAPYLDLHAERWGDFLNLSPSMFKDFAWERPHYIRQHIKEYFGLSGTARLTFDVSSPDAGEIRLNTIRLNTHTPGLRDAKRPFPWTGEYFEGVPLHFTAKAFPGFEFAGWKETPSADASVTIIPVAGTRNTAQFRKSKTSQLLHYWNFNEPQSLLHVTRSKGGGTLTHAPGPSSELTYGTLGGFIGENALFEDPPALHLRLNNPIGSMLSFALPTSGFHSVRVEYETRRSGSGAGIQLIEVSADGEIFHPFKSILVENAPAKVVSLDLSSVPAAFDNPNFTVRIRFNAGLGGSEGNVRFDNFTVYGAPILYLAGEFAYEGIFKGNNHFETKELGQIAHDTSWGSWSYWHAGEWVYFSERYSEGFILYLPQEQMWYWLPIQVGGYAYCFASRQWVNFLYGG